MQDQSTNNFYIEINNHKHIKKKKQGYETRSYLILMLNKLEVMGGFTSIYI